MVLGVFLCWLALCRTRSDYPIRAGCKNTKNDASLIVLAPHVSPCTPHAEPADVTERAVGGACAKEAVEFEQAGSAEGDARTLDIANKTPEGRSATFRVQRLGFCFLFFFSFFDFFFSSLLAGRSKVTRVTVGHDTDQPKFSTL